ncbi:hypothetical protein N0V85_005019 [Neurospora sp. IMI 360204]|nr:hypothetical protein N0V85_005019 [Neurospora sp. IMI 360204]
MSRAGVPIGHIGKEYPDLQRNNQNNTQAQSVAFSTTGNVSTFNLPTTAVSMTALGNGIGLGSNLKNQYSLGRAGPDHVYHHAAAAAAAPTPQLYNPRPAPVGPAYTSAPSHGAVHGHLNGQYRSTAPNLNHTQGGWGDHHHPASSSRFASSSSDSVDDIMGSPSLSDYSLDNPSLSTAPSSKPGGNKNHHNHHNHNGNGNNNGRGGRSQRRPSNRDEFDGPHQFLQRPSPEYIAMQERELPHLPTNLLVQEQDSVLTQVNDRLSQCAYDFVAKYQFPIPLTQDMRPVERPQDREWTEWVYLLKRLATKRRIPARVLYNGQIKQFVTILENSLEMRHAAKHQSRPLKDDRNILQLISAGIQVAKILKDAPAMDFLDKLYVSTEQQIQERAAAAAARFR